MTSAGANQKQRLLAYQSLHDIDTVGDAVGGFVLGVVKAHADPIRAIAAVLFFRDESQDMHSGLLAGDLFNETAGAWSTAFNHQQIGVELEPGKKGMSLAGGPRRDGKDLPSAQLLGEGEQEAEITI